MAQNIELKTGVMGGTAVPISSIYEETVDQKFGLGSLYVTDDERKFRYAKNGAVALGKALMCQAPVEIAHHKGIALGTAAAVGDEQFTISTTLSTATTKDQYKDGYIQIVTGTGIGQIFRVKSNTAGTTCVVTLYDKVVTACATTDTFTLKANPWNGVLVAANSQTGIPVGVPLAPVTISYYCWIQVSGPSAMIADTTDVTVLGAPVGRSSTQAVPGAVGVVTNDGTDNVYGNCMTAAAAASAIMVFLTLE